MKDLSRRAFLAAAAAGAVLPTLAETASATSLFSSPPVQPYRDALIPPSIVTGDAHLPMAAGTHTFHSQYPASTTWGYGGAGYHGPVVQATQGQPTTLRVPNRLGRHALASNVDTTLMHMSDLDITAPRSNVHLHGSFSRPEQDGSPYDTYRPGATRAYKYDNKEGAKHLWFHDHALSMTRLNVAAGLASHYIVRDQYDTGTAANTLGLPYGDAEMPLLIEDKMFDPNGRLWYRFTPLAGENRWSGTFYGDRTVVNGTVWPRVSVTRGVHRFRVLNGSAATQYRLTLNGAAPMYVIGSDLGLLNAPVKVDALTIASGERYDVLIDFTNVAAGTRIELRNTQAPHDVNMLLGAQTVTQVLAFDVTSTLGVTRTVPTRLRGGAGQPAAIALAPASTVNRVMTLVQLVDLNRIFPPVRQSLNNLGFMTNYVDIGKAGTTETWEVVNTTTIPHPIHVHMATLRLINRQAMNISAYQLFNPVPFFGIPWRPANPGLFASAPAAPAAGYELGEKDTIIAAPNSVTRFKVTWPTGAQLGFDPDATYVAGALLKQDGTAPMPPMTHEGSLQGYVWHCHFLDHEDHDMMLPIRFRL